MNAGSNKNTIRKNKPKLMSISIFLLFLQIILCNSIAMNKPQRNLDEISTITNQFDDEIIICDIYSMFKESRTCKINKTSIDQDIINGLAGSESSQYYEYLSSSIFQYKNEVSTKEDNEIFTIGKLEKDEEFDFMDCEDKLKNYYKIPYNETIIIYKHQINEEGYKAPVIGFELFFDTMRLNVSAVCPKNVIHYYFQVEIEDNELFKYYKSNIYYSDDCEIGSLSLYDRKKEYNDKNLSLCKKDCDITNYNPQTKIVTCACLTSNSNINRKELFHKFELLEEDKYKCISITTANPAKIPITEKIDISTTTTSKTKPDINIVNTNQNIKFTEDIEQLFFENNGFNSFRNMI